MKYIKPTVIITLLIFSLFLPNTLQADYKSFMAKLKNVDAIQAVAFANQWRWTNKNITIYVNAQEIVFTFPDGQVKKIPMPENKMLVAVAPYISKTHTWATHYFSSCQGELANETLKIKAVDQDGRVLFDGTIETLRNGFFEVWFPRNRKINLTVQRNNTKAKGVIETFDGSMTCITTFRLQ